ncbi:MAG: hypothetical protein Q9175_001822 [Cornicularia normoerica]
MFRRSLVIFAASLALLSTFDLATCFAAAAPAQPREDLEMPRFLRKEIKRFVFTNTTTWRGGSPGEVSTSDSEALYDALTSSSTQDLGVDATPTSATPTITATPSVTPSDNEHLSSSDVSQSSAARDNDTARKAVLALQASPTTTPVSSAPPPSSSPDNGESVTTQISIVPGRISDGSTGSTQSSPSSSASHLDRVNGGEVTPQSTYTSTVEHPGNGVTSQLGSTAQPETSASPSSAALLGSLENLQQTSDIAHRTSSSIASETFVSIAGGQGSNTLASQTPPSTGRQTDTSVQADKTQGADTLQLSFSSKGVETASATISITDSSSLTLATGGSTNSNSKQTPPSTGRQTDTPVQSDKTQGVDTLQSSFSSKGVEITTTTILITDLSSLTLGAKETIKSNSKNEADSLVSATNTATKDTENPPLITTDAVSSTVIPPTGTTIGSNTNDVASQTPPSTGLQTDTQVQSENTQNALYSSFSSKGVETSPATTKGPKSSPLITTDAVSSIVIPPTGTTIGSNTNDIASQTSPSTGLQTDTQVQSENTQNVFYSSFSSKGVEITTTTISITDLSSLALGAGETIKSNSKDETGRLTGAVTTATGGPKSPPLTTTSAVSSAVVPLAGTTINSNANDLAPGVITATAGIPPAATSGGVSSAAAPGETVKTSPKNIDNHSPPDGEATSGIPTPNTKTDSEGSAIINTNVNDVVPTTLGNGAGAATTHAAQPASSSFARQSVTVPATGTNLGSETSLVTAGPGTQPTLAPGSGAGPTSQISGLSGPSASIALQPNPAHANSQAGGSPPQTTLADGAVVPNTAQMTGAAKDTASTLETLPASASSPAGDPISTPNLNAGATKAASILNPSLAAAASILNAIPASIESPLATVSGNPPLVFNPALTAAASVLGALPASIQNPDHQVSLAGSLLSASPVVPGGSSSPAGGPQNTAGATGAPVIVGSPIGETASPVEGTKSPIGTASPVGGTKSPIGTASPVGETELPIGTGSPFVGTASPVKATGSLVEVTGSPVEATGSPVGETASPVAGTKSQVGATGSPVGEIPSLVGVTGSPVATGSPTGSPVAGTKPQIEATSSPIGATSSPMGETPSAVGVKGSPVATGSPVGPTGSTLGVSGGSPIPATGASVGETGSPVATASSVGGTGLPIGGTGSLVGETGLPSGTGSPQGSGQPTPGQLSGEKVLPSGDIYQKPQNTASASAVSGSGPMTASNGEVINGTPAPTPQSATPESGIAGYSTQSNGNVVPISAAIGTGSTVSEGHIVPVATGDEVSAQPPKPNETGEAAASSAVQGASAAAIAAGATQNNAAPPEPTATPVVPPHQQFSGEGPYTQSPVGYDTSTTQVVPTSILHGSSSTPSATQGGTFAPFNLPSNVPHILYQNGGPGSQPPKTRLINIAFRYALNYLFVYNHTISQEQIFHYLPRGICYGLGIEISQITMQSLRAWDTYEDVGYITTLALAWIPEGLVESLGLLVSTSGSTFYHNPDNSTAFLLSMINSAVPITGSNGTDGASTPFGNIPTDTNSTKTAGAPIGGDIGHSEHVRASSVGIGVGVACGAAAYGAAMFFVARRYKKRRKSHLRSPSMFSSPVMSHAGPDAGAGAALMSGAMGGRSGSPYHDNDGRAGSRGSGRSGSSRHQISAPVMAENSLGWN